VRKSSKTNRKASNTIELETKNRYKFPATWHFGHHNYPSVHEEGQFTGIGFVDTQKLPDANTGNEITEVRSDKGSQS
jgi:hypothetical protein